MRPTCARGTLASCGSLAPRSATLEPFSPQVVGFRVTADNEMRTPVILVVDDEALLRLLAATEFAQAGFEVIEAANGAQALTILARRADIRAVFTDIQMPGTPDGLALAKHVRDLRPDCAIVVASGRIEPDEDDLAARARFIPKPYSCESVIGMVREMIGAPPEGRPQAPIA